MITLSFVIDGYIVTYILINNLLLIICAELMMGKYCSNSFLAIIFYACI